jgi:hypothetical protein
MLSSWVMINIGTMAATALVWVPFLSRWLKTGFSRAGLLAVAVIAAQIPSIIVFFALMPMVVAPVWVLPLMLAVVTISLTIVALVLQRLEGIVWKQALLVSFKLYGITLIVRFLVRATIALFA